MTTDNNEPQSDEEKRQFLAERVMGWKWSDLGPDSIADPCWVDPDTEIRAAPFGWNPMASWDAAMQVVTKINEMGLIEDWVKTLAMMWPPDWIWIARIATATPRQRSEAAIRVLLAKERESE